MFSMFGKPILLPIKVKVPKKRIKNTPASILRLIRKLDDFWFMSKIIVYIVFQNVYLVQSKKVNATNLSYSINIVYNVLFVSSLNAT